MDDETVRRLAEMADNEIRTPEPAPPWADPNHDVMGDLMRAARALGLAGPSRSYPAPVTDIRVGDHETFSRLIRDADIRMMPAAEQQPVDRLLGIPIVVDPRMPRNAIRIGDRWFTRRDDGTWFSFDMAEVERVARDVFGGTSPDAMTQTFDRETSD